MEKIIENRIKGYAKDVDKFFELVKEFKHIAVFRHDHPDYDAFGSQLGLATFIKDNWPDKDVIYVGDDHVSLTNKCFPVMQTIDDAWFDQEFLAIIVDLSTIDRAADTRYEKAKCIVKIDHHPAVDSYGDLQIVDDTMIAAGELIASMLLSKPEYKISKETAANLYKAIVGDSGRFLYSHTTNHTFFIAQKLLETGFDLVQAYNEMYDENLTDLEVRKYVLKHYKITKHGVAYYVLTDKILKKFGLLPIQGKDNVNVFAHFKGIHAWLSITEDVAKGNWRVSIRSAGTEIDKFAERFGGGGHTQASATKLKTWREVTELIKELDKMFE